MNQVIRIGTRESRLALWQAHFVSDLLQIQGYSTEIIPVKSEGDIDLITPIYQMGVQGVFTKSLDAALLNNRIDIAVHSLKDVPTAIPQGLMLASVPEREDWRDVLVTKDDLYPSELDEMVVATGSLRRKAQWLRRFPGHHIDELRGNIQTRLDKLNQSNWHGAIFAYAGIKRVNLPIEHFQFLDWMLPSPAQGALGVVCRSDDDRVIKVCQSINHKDSAMATFVERSFLNGMNAGCTMPVAGLCSIDGENLNFKGNVLSKDGRTYAEVEWSCNVTEYRKAGALAAEKLLETGGKSIVETFGKLQ